MHSLGSGELKKVWWKMMRIGAVTGLEGRSFEEGHKCNLMRKKNRVATNDEGVIFPSFISGLLNARAASLNLRYSRKVI